MIVVIGAVVARRNGTDIVPGGLASEIALAAAAAGARVEVVARIGDDPPGDAVLLAFAAAGVGHVATLRDAARTTPVTLDDDDEPIDPDPDPAPDPRVDSAGGRPAAPAPTLDAADVGLALRYLSDYRVIVAVHPADPGMLAEIEAAAGYASAYLVVVTDPEAEPVDEAPPAALIVEATSEAVGFGRLLGRHAAAVDLGEDPATAFAMLSAAASIGEP